MRKGRFAGLNEKGPEAAPPLSPGRLLLFDFRPAANQHDERAAAERAQALAHSAPFLFLAHLLCGGALLIGSDAFRSSEALWLAAPPIVAVLLLDLRLWAMSRPGADSERKPHATVRLSALYAVLLGLLWMLAGAAIEVAGAQRSPLADAALVGGIAAALAAFLPIPGLLLIACIAALGLVAEASGSPALLGLAAGFSALLVGLSLYRARDALIAAQQRLQTDWKAAQTSRFVADFEESGGGWFWETNADGALTYVSPALARELGREPTALQGKRFSALIGEAEGGEEGGTLAFHLAARFPFSDLLVWPDGREGLSWSLSGKPNFDEFGRFLGFRGVGASLSALRRSELESKKQATRDSLTGLPNRAGMRTMLDEALANAASRRQSCALFLIDLDRFKQVNDTLGHPIGDELLKDVAKRLADVLGSEGQAGRLGGDEFKAVIPGIGEEGHLAGLAERLIKAVSAPYFLRGHAVQIGASVGIAIARPGRTLADTLIHEADLALYSAKGAGRGTWRFFDPAMDEKAAGRRILESELRDALAKGQLRIDYAPVLNAQDERLTGFETVVRWNHPTKGLLGPREFLPLADAAGIGGAIGEWAIRTALAGAARWPSPLRIAIALNAAELRQPGLRAVIAGAMAATGVDPDRVEIGVPEEALLAGGESTAEMLRQLRGLGCRLVLDGYGEGTASLSSLKAAPLNRIKIHRSLLRAAAAEPESSGIVLAGLVRLAADLGIETTLDGVDTIEGVELARAIGCTAVQGPRFGKPLQEEEAGALAARGADRGENAHPSRPPRHKLIRRGTLLAGGEEIAVRLRNVSQGGAMIECAAEFVPGTAAELDLGDGLRLAAETRWCAGGLIGLRFAEALDLASLGAGKRRAAAKPKVLQPDYLKTEGSPDSPWAGRSERLARKDVLRG